MPIYPQAPMPCQAIFMLPAFTWFFFGPFYGLW